MEETSSKTVAKNLLIDSSKTLENKCDHIKKMEFSYVCLAEIICKLGPAIKSNSITRWLIEGCDVGVPEANLLFNTFRDMNSLMEELTAHRLR